MKFALSRVKRVACSLFALSLGSALTLANTAQAQDEAPPEPPPAPAKPQ